MITVRKATSQDVDNIYNILQPYVIGEIILERSKDDILQHIEEFFIANENNSIVGTISFHDYGNNLFEIRSLAVNNQFKKHGAGRALVTELINQLRSDHTDCKIFTLTYVPEFFIKNNFKIVEKDTLPEKIWKDCVNCPKIDCCEEIALVYK